MNKYILKYILLIIGVILFAFAITTVAIVVLKDHSNPWGITVISVTCLAGITHIIASTIYDKNKDPKNNLNIPKSAIGIIFMISSLCQIICTLVSIVEACKRFGDIHPLEYFSAAIFMLASAYAYKKSVYTLIDKEKNNEQ